MAAFNTSNLIGGTQQSLSSTYKSIVSLSAATATLTSAAIVEFTFSTDTTPADNAIVWDVSRITAITSGTGNTTLTPLPTDIGKRAAGTVSCGNFTSEPTVTSNSTAFTMGLNQRASFRWVAV